MNPYDDFVTETQKTEKTEKENVPEFHREEWIARKKAEREHVYELIDQAAAGAVSDKEHLLGYLDVQSRFPEYSVGNALLITAQMPQATKLGEFGYWQERGLMIRRGEIGIFLLKPGKEFTRQDGTSGVRYNAARFFDISQTNARVTKTPEPERDWRALLRTLIDEVPCEVRMDESVRFPENRAAYYDASQKVLYVDRGHDPKMTFREIARELVHAQLDKGEYTREDSEFTAACVSYMICRRSGIEPEGSAFPEIPERFSSLNPKEVRRELSKMRDAAGGISRNMEQAAENQKPEKPKEQER